MPCETYKGPRGGRYYMKRKKGGGTEKRYLKKGERAPRRE